MNLSRFKSVLSSLTKEHKWFCFFAMVCNFLICAEYATIRPVSNSLFIHAYSSQFFPYAWLAVIPLNFLIVWLYNHFLPKWGCAKLFLATIIFVMGGNLFFALFIDKWLCLPFLFYIWKEVYILLLFQQLYSVIHETVKMDLAKLLYGFFFGIGGIGSLFGSLFPGLCAVQIGSQALLYLSLPFCLLLLSAYYFLIRYSAAKTIHADLPKAASTGFVHGMNLIVSSKGLFFILAIVVLMQAATTIIDFQFNSYLERLYPDKDLRTEYIAKVFGVVHGFTIFFQFIGTYLLLEWIKLRGAHLFVPAVFLCNTAACLFFPGFGAMASAFITTKSFDFSIFNVIKEMLYIPLKADEKFRAKAVIDIFAYRSSKALASFLILAIPYALALSSILAVLYLIWLFVVLKYFRQQDIAVINERS